MSFTATPEGKIGWKEMGLSEGQIVTCLRNIKRDGSDGDFWTDRLTIGKQYKIDDVEWRFWDKICVVSDYSNRSEFVPVEFFCEELADKRDKKIEEILKK